jgi:hypothetical protein
MLRLLLPVLIFVTYVRKTRLRHKVRAYSTRPVSNIYRQRRCYIMPKVPHCVSLRVERPRTMVVDYVTANVLAVILLARVGSAQMAIPQGARQY